MQSIIQNYSVLQSLWDQATDIVHDTETIARIRGVAAHMQSFEFFFALVLGEILLHHTDNLSKTLQKTIRHLRDRGTKSGRYGKKDSASY